MKTPVLEDWRDSKLLEKEIQKIIKAEMPSNRKYEFRISNSIPYCPLIEILHEQENDKFDSSFYFKVGTAIHSLFQTFAPKALGKNLIGTFSCTRELERTEQDNTTTKTFCSFKKHFTTLDSTLKQGCPHNDPQCKKNPQFIYDEIEIDYKGLKGHTDMLLKINKKYYLIDFKTTSDFLFESRGLASGYYPSLKYWHQLETYACLLELQYKIVIDQYSILYVSRGKPASRKDNTHMWFTRKLTDKIRKERKNYIDLSIKKHKIAKLYLNKKINKNKLFKARACHKPSDHNNLMAHSFFDKKCPHWVSNACTAKKLLK